MKIYYLLSNYQNAKLILILIYLKIFQKAKAHHQ